MTVIIVCLAWGLVFGVIASLVWSFSTAKGTLADVLATLSIVLLTVYALVPNRPDWIAPGGHIRNHSSSTSGSIALAGLVFVAAGVVFWIASRTGAIRAISQRLSRDDPA
jgi:hypothetical protein